MVMLSLSIIFIAFATPVKGEFLQMTPVEIDLSRVIRNITGLTMTACYMKCANDERCDSFGVTEKFDGHLHICHLLQKSNSSTEGEGKKTILQGTGLIKKPSPINGGFSAWKNSTSCSKTCGAGNMTYTRSCDNPKPQHGGVDCCGEKIKTEPCLIRYCPVNGGFSAWKNSTSCSKTCGVGHVTYTRSCDNPKPQHGGADCRGEKIKTEPCLIRYCQLNGGFSAWKKSTSCSKTCGVGHVTYTRSCDNPIPQHGGADCRGEKIKTEPCLIRYCQVCYGAKNNDFGEFVVWKTGQLKAICLSHISGSLYCTSREGGRWGCSLYNNGGFQVVITNEENNHLFPESTGPYYYEDKGATINDDQLTLSRKHPIKVHQGQKLRIWDYHDLINESEYNNSGKHCVFIQLIYDE